MNTATALSPELEVDINRSRIYYLLAAGFSWPDDKLKGALAELWTLADTLFPELELDRKVLEQSDAEIEAEYINVFDGHDNKHHCKPYEGLWHDADRAKRQWEVKKFYHVFGLEMNPAVHEMPDHIMYELEFMHYLSTRMVQALRKEARQQDPNGPRDYLQAQVDFMQRHLSQWLPAFCEHLPKTTEFEIYRQLGRITEKFIAEDQAWLEARLESFEPDE